MPLTRKITFQGIAEKSNKIQVPMLIRNHFKIEYGQPLKVSVNALDLGRGCQFFYTKMTKDGRIRIPKLVSLILRGEKPSLQGYLIETTLEPA